MEMIYVESGNLQAVGYDVEQQILYVEFKHGDTYQYFGVDGSIYEGLLNAGSKGTYLNQMVKKAGYQYSKL